MILKNKIPGDMFCRDFVFIVSKPGKPGSVVNGYLSMPYVATRL